MPGWLLMLLSEKLNNACMKKIFTLILLMYGLSIFNVFAQSSAPGICEGDVTLSSQAEVDAFNCTEITGSLTISGADIVDLSPLNILTKVGTIIISENTNL